jgi:hypothetical protein
MSRKPKAEKRAVQLLIPVTPREKKLAKDLARKRHVTVAQCFRDLLYTHVEMEKSRKAQRAVEKSRAA